MVRGVVQTKPFSKKRSHKKRFKSNDFKWNINPATFIKVIIFFMILIVVVYWWTYVLKHTLFDQKYSIKTTEYAEDSVKTFSDPYLYSKIEEILKDENYYVVAFLKRKKILWIMKNEFPMINDLNIVYWEPGVVQVQIDFTPPDLIIKHRWFSFGINEDLLFTIFSWDLIWSWALSIFLPQYIWDITSIDWIFFDTEIKTIIAQMYLLQNYFPDNKQIIYMPWAQRTTIFLPWNKKLYINNFKQIEEQLKNYEKLKKFYVDFDKIYSVDLWSLENDRVIVRK